MGAAYLKAPKPVMEIDLPPRCGKMPFSTAREARNQKRNARNMLSDTTPYICLRCGKWHVTSMVKKGTEEPNTVRAKTKTALIREERRF